MNYIVLDLEWNQSPAGKMGKRKGLPFEIIEIGAVKLNETLDVLDTFQEVIHPTVYRQLHYKTKEIIHIEKDELANARKFKAVLRDFFAWCGEDYRICTWGSMDLMELQRNLSYFHVKHPLKAPVLYYDIQKLYSILYADGRERTALKSAVEFLDIHQDIPFHRALDDTLYTAKVMQNIDFGRVSQYISVDYYSLPKSKADEIHLSFDNYEKYVSRLFPDKEHAMEDPEVSGVTCYKCGRSLRQRISWFSPNGKNYLSLSYCPEHGYVKGKIRIRRAERGGVYIVKTTKLISPKDADDIRNKCLEIERRRKERKEEQ